MKRLQHILTEISFMYTLLHFPHLNTCLKRFDDNCGLVKSGNARQKCTICEHTHMLHNTQMHTQTQAGSQMNTSFEENMKLGTIRSITFFQDESKTATLLI